VSEAHLRVLLYRARLMLQDHILDQVQATAEEVFTFGGERCARVTRYVLFAISTPAAGIGLEPATPGAY
jgi:hypothetical protein